MAQTGRLQGGTKPRLHRPNGAPITPRFGFLSVHKPDEPDLIVRLVVVGDRTLTEL
jgi:hypothetical protein